MVLHKKELHKRFLARASSPAIRYRAFDPGSASDDNALIQVWKATDIRAHFGFTIPGICALLRLRFHGQLGFFKSAI
jgi:hypothetical protein